jgi:hypothetical protein
VVRATYGLLPAGDEESAQVGGGLSDRLQEALDVGRGRVGVIVEIDKQHEVRAGQVGQGLLLEVVPREVELLADAGQVAISVPYI